MIERDITQKEENKIFLEAAEQFYTDARELYEKDVEQRKRKTDKIHYFILRGYDEFRDGDEWIGIYHSRDEARDVYNKAAGELEKEHQEDIEQYGEKHCKYTATHEKILVNIFNENIGKWSYNVDPQIIFNE